jgi:hypothetical protein
MNPIGHLAGLGANHDGASNSSNTLTEHLMDRSFDDDKRNTFE